MGFLHPQIKTEAKTVQRPSEVLFFQSDRYTTPLNELILNGRTQSQWPFNVNEHLACASKVIYNVLPTSECFSALKGCAIANAWFLAYLCPPNLNLLEL